jgi:aminopeptidase N
MRRQRNVQAGLACALAALGAQAAHATPAAPAVRITAYDVAITPDFDRHAITGRTEIRFRTTADGRVQLSFSPNALIIDEATIDGAPVTAERSADALRFVSDRALRRGQAGVLTVRYHGVPARGLSFSRDAVSTQYFTCDWMICDLDPPGAKAPLTLRLSVPREMTTVASGALVSQTPTADGRKLVVWRERQAYSAYLYGFAAGRFHTVTLPGHAGGLTAVSAVADEVRLKALFAETGAMAAFFEDRAGVPLPHGRYTQVLVEGGAAQEVSSFSVVGLEGMTPVLSDPHEDWLAAHELAHQWWGNLITCAQWRDFWLNEGMTTFMVAAWKEHRWGRPAYDREMDVARRRLDSQIKADRDYPLAWAGAYPSLRAKRAIDYSKGALFLDALRRDLGERAFWAGLKAYTRANAGRSVTSADFQDAMQRASGRDLSALFTEWVWGPGPRALPS